MSCGTMDIAVVIPYFQREAGVLARSLRSVAAQQPCGATVRVLVVDDASPAPAEPEIEGISWPSGMSVQLIHQANGGPGAARNTGIEAAGDTCRYIAFLDSDDEWTADHLQRSIAALEAGYDFYFSDLVQLGATVGAFARAGRIQVQDHPRLVAKSCALPPDLHTYQGDMFNQVLMGNVVGTPTVVYRKEKFGSLRFRIELATAGEDYLFWMELCLAGARVAFSSQVEAFCGRGVNVYARSGWGTDGHALRIHHELTFKKLLLNRFKLTPPQAAAVSSALPPLRKAFIGDFLHRLGHRKPLHWRLIVQHLLADPATLMSLPAVLAARVKGQLA